MGNPHLRIDVERCHKKHQHNAIISYFNTNTVKSIVIFQSTRFVIKCFVLTDAEMVKQFDNGRNETLQIPNIFVNHLPESQMALVSAMFWRVQ